MNLNDVMPASMLQKPAALIMLPWDDDDDDDILANDDAFYAKWLCIPRVAVTHFSA